MMIVPFSESPAAIFDALGVGSGRKSKLPFSFDDITAGSESELQVVVVGDKSAVDLPIQIEQSSFFANISRRVATGDSPKRIINSLERYLNDNDSRVWENSWVRFSLRKLTSFGREVLRRDLLADKSNENKGIRSDEDRFLYRECGEDCVRIPISYLLKLSLADLMGSQNNAPALIRNTGMSLLTRFLNDNTSPETHSFYIVRPDAKRSIGNALARETAKRFLLSQLLVMYANGRFGLRDSGQKAMVYFAPNAPVRQRDLNESISDSFYRELFMSPCLSGWNNGEEKHAYMNLCHQVLSRSQLNAVSKLRDAGIIANNLVILPSTSNISLANNGTHVSLGSRSLTEARRQNHPGFGSAEEKLVGDLTIKVFEHFLPLFVGTYTAAPYRFDFMDFHPERVLGFLPHELDYTHLRMIWRRWKRKARIGIFGQPVTPLGPRWLDLWLKTIFHLQGDYVTDFRLIDYLVAILSTHRSPALDGRPGNAERLKKDLASLGVFDAKMSLYLLYRLREYGAMGFTGFEGRYYSAFERFGDDLGKAVDLQAFVTALALKYQCEGKLTHACIPDDPSIESERRQIFFGAAIGIPTFYVRRNTSNLFLRSIIARTKKTRPSHRYSGYTRVQNVEYRKALIQIILEDAPDLIEMFDLWETIADLKDRLENPETRSVEGRLKTGVLSGVRVRTAMGVPAREFNQRAEEYYREHLRQRQIREAFVYLREDFDHFLDEGVLKREEVRRCLAYCFGLGKLSDLLTDSEEEAVQDLCSEERLKFLVNVVLLSVAHDQAESCQGKYSEESPVEHSALLC